MSVPCRGCGRTFFKIAVEDGSVPLKCESCGATTTAKVRCRGEACQVFTAGDAKGPPGPR